MVRPLLNWLGLRANTVPIDETRLIVVSPHLDDAVFSLGAALRRAARRGIDVTVLTVFAGDPAATEPAGWWDLQAGFQTAGEAATARRGEDARACSLLGVTPRWLPFGDKQYGVASEDAVLAALRPELEGSGLILVPGFPLEHEDHEWLSRLVLEHRPSATRILLYAEQPYLLWQQTDPPAGWKPAAAALPDRVQKLRACRAYTSQLQIMGRDLPWQLARFEAAHGGELVGTLD